MAASGLDLSALQLLSPCSGCLLKTCIFIAEASRVWVTTTTVNSAHTAAVALDRCRSVLHDGLHLSSWPSRRPRLGSEGVGCAAPDKTGLEVTDGEHIEDADLHVVLLVCLMCVQHLRRTSPSFRMPAACT